MSEQTSSRARIRLWVLLGLLLVAGMGIALPWRRLLTSAEPLVVEVMTCNVRHGLAPDGADDWNHRKDFLAEVMKQAAPDLIGLQEAHQFQVQDLLVRLPGFDALGECRDGADQGESCAILYRKERFLVTDSGTFWLSDTPDRVSASWGNQCRRICTWVRLIDRSSGRALWCYNTHLDHQSATARERSAPLIMQTIARQTGSEAFLLCGDLNSGEDSKVIAYLKGQAPLPESNPLPLRDSWRVRHPDEAACGTISRFTGSMEPIKIDYILVPVGVEVEQASILRPRRDGRDATDHYPVTARLRW